MKTQSEIKEKLAIAEEKLNNAREFFKKAIEESEKAFETCKVISGEFEAISQLLEHENSKA